MLKKILKIWNMLEKAGNCYIILITTSFRSMKDCLINVGPCILNNSKLCVHPYKTKIHGYI